MSVHAQQGGSTPATVPVGTYWSYDLLGWAYDNSLRTWTSPGEWRFRGQDTFYGSRGYGPDFDYPNPAGHAWIQRQYTSDLRTWIVPGGQRRFVGQDTFYGTKGKAPTFDYPNPVGHAWLNRVFIPEYRTWAYKYTPELIGKDKFYGTAGEAPTFDYPNPKGYYTTNYSWYKDWVLNLRETPKPNLLPLPFDWGYQEKLNWYREWAFNATVRLPVVVTAVPFKQTDWPNPKGYYSTNYNWYQNWIVNLRELPSTPILLPLPFDWGYQEKLQWYRDWILNATIRLPITVVTAPFNQDDWPNPKFNPTLDYSYIEFMDLARNASLGKPFRQLEWVNPAIPPRPDFTYIEVMDLPRNHSLGKTFKQTDWPNFREFRDKREWTWNYNLNLIGKDRLPNRQQDWPNPTVVTWYKDWNNNLILIVPVVARAPFSQLDWPLPLAPTYWARDWNQNLILTFGPTPVVVTDLHFKPIRTAMGRMGNLGGLH